jgi:hypothetical protein
MDFYPISSLAYRLQTTAFHFKPQNHAVSIFLISAVGLHSNNPWL